MVMTWELQLNSSSGSAMCRVSQAILWSFWVKLGLIFPFTPRRLLGLPRTVAHVAHPLVTLLQISFSPLMSQNCVNIVLIAVADMWPVSQWVLATSASASSSVHVLRRPAWTCCSALSSSPGSSESPSDWSVSEPRSESVLLFVSCGIDSVDASLIGCSPLPRPIADPRSRSPFGVASRVRRRGWWEDLLLWLVP